MRVAIATAPITFTEFQVLPVKVVEQRELRAFRGTSRFIFISSRVGGSRRSPGPGWCLFAPQQTSAGTLRYNPFTGDLYACVIVNARAWQNPSHVVDYY